MAGPVNFMTAPEPTNSPAPMIPPREIIVMCRGLRPRSSPGLSPVSVAGTVVPSAICHIPLGGVASGYPAPKRPNGPGSMRGRWETAVGCPQSRVGHDAAARHPTYQAGEACHETDRPCGVPRRAPGRGRRRSDVGRRRQEAVEDVPRALQAGHLEGQGPCRRHARRRTPGEVQPARSASVSSRARAPRFASARRSPAPCPASRPTAVSATRRATSSASSARARRAPRAAASPRSP